MMIRNGQWVQFTDYGGLYDGAFRARNGQVVGIFVYGDENGPPYVAVVDKHGDNLARDGINLSASPYVEGLSPVMDRLDIPPERIKHLPKNWQPKSCWVW